jgi:DegV family protein with EDD domain
MTDFHIVTDSCANLPDPTLLERFPITVVPNRIKIGDRVFREGVDLEPAEAIRLIASHPAPPIVIPPSEADFVHVYSQVSRTSDAILSIHASREMSRCWSNARQASQQLSGSRIAVIDSQTLDMGQGLLVQAAAYLAARITDFEELIRQVRGKVESIYSIYYTETVDYLVYNQIMTESHGILGAMLNIKPCLTIENGKLIPIEKVRTRQQAIERLHEFIVEFDDLQDAVILQAVKGLTEQAQMLRERLSIDFPEREFPVFVYNASLAAMIGPDATGLVILEDIHEGNDDI